MKYTIEQIELLAKGNGVVSTDVLRHLLAENDALRESVKKANAQAEHFEREWYLRGDEVEALREDAERWRYARDNCDMSLSDCSSYVWFVADSGHRINVNTWATSENERAIDASRKSV